MTSRVFLLGAGNLQRAPQCLTALSDTDCGALPCALLRSPIRTVARASAPCGAPRYGPLCAPTRDSGTSAGTKTATTGGAGNHGPAKYRRFSLKHTEPCQNDPCLRTAAAGGEKLGFNDIVGYAAKNKRCEVRWPAKGRAVRWTFSNRRRSQALS